MQTIAKENIFLSFFIFPHSFLDVSKYIFYSKQYFPLRSTGSQGYVIRFHFEVAYLYNSVPLTGRTQSSHFFNLQNRFEGVAAVFLP